MIIKVAKVTIGNIRLKVSLIRLFVSPLRGSALVDFLNTPVVYFLLLYIDDQWFNLSINIREVTCTTNILKVMVKLFAINAFKAFVLNI